MTAEVDTSGIGIYLLQQQDKATKHLQTNNNRF